MIWIVVGVVLLVGYFFGWAVAIWGAEPDDDEAMREFRAYRAGLERGR